MSTTATNNMATQTPAQHFKSELPFHQSQTQQQQQQPSWDTMVPLDVDHFFDTPARPIWTEADDAYTDDRVVNWLNNMPTTPELFISIRGIEGVDAGVCYHFRSSEDLLEGFTSASQTEENWGLDQSWADQVDWDQQDNEKNENETTIHRPELREVEDTYEERNNGIGEDKLGLEVHFYYDPENCNYDENDNDALEDMFRLGAYFYTNTNNSTINHATPPTNEPTWLSLATPPRYSVLAELRGLFLSAPKSNPYYFDELKKQIATEESLEEDEADFQEALNHHSHALHSSALKKLDMLLWGWDPTLGSEPEAATSQTVNTKVNSIEQLNKEEVSSLATTLGSFDNLFSSSLNTAAQKTDNTSLNNSANGEPVSINDLLTDWNTAFGNSLDAAEDSLTNGVDSDSTDSQTKVTDQKPSTGTPVAKRLTTAKHLEKSEEGDLLFDSWWAWELRKGGVGKMRKKWKA